MLSMLFWRVWIISDCQNLQDILFCLVGKSSHHDPDSPPSLRLREFMGMTGNQNHES